MSKVAIKASSKVTASSKGTPKKNVPFPDRSDSQGTIPRKSSSRRPADITSSSIEPPTKKNRSDSDERPNGRNNGSKQQPGGTEPTGEDKTRRRRTLKAGDNAEPQCTFCKNSQSLETEPLQECSACKAKFHIRKCLRYKDELAVKLSELEEWFCPRCITCSACNKFIGDPQNVECSSCCRTWHGVCAPKGYYPSTDFDSAWFCSTCAKERNLKDDTYSDIHNKKSRNLVPSGRRSRATKDALEFNGDIDELTDLINKRDYTWDFLNHEAGFSSKPPIPPSPIGNVSISCSKKNHADDEFDYKNTGRNAPIPNIVAKDVKLFAESAEEAYPQKASSNTMSNGQYLHFGTGKSCRAIYSSAYEEPLFSSPHLYSCKFCLHTTHLKEDLVVHWDHCTATHPPGNEIYRDDGLSFFEVDGAVQKKYCQDLCLLAKLFIASKTLYDEVETFIFYVLCEITTEGFVIVGYFSKEKNPSKNNNLSCLLVLPMVQKMGYGRLLIDMSYELSRRERKVGHPEHPLSDLGILAYRGYWRSSLLCYLRQHRNSDRLSIKDISLATRITPVDIVNQLMLDNIINFKGGVYSIKISKRALKFPLSQCRRRCINAGRLIWKPLSFEHLDPTKINSYV